MDVTAAEKLHEKCGAVNVAFEMKDRADVLVECGSEVPNGTPEEDKSLLERKLREFQNFLGKHKNQGRRIINLVLAAGCVAIVTGACVVNFHRALGLLIFSLITIFFLVWDWMMERYDNLVREALAPIRTFLKRNWFCVRWVMYCLFVVAVVCWLALDTAQRGTRQLVSFGGLLLLIFLMLVFSKHPFKWSLQTLLCGVGLQFLCGLLVLRTNFGLQSLQWVGNKVERFLSFADAGSEFVFGVNYRDHFFVFRVMPILVFLSSTISVLYHVGFMPWLISKIGFVMQVTMATSPTESMVAAGNIFLGITDSPLLIRPYISTLTMSEIHAVLSCGFASISGTLLGAFISLGVDAAHLLTAALMSAPASLAIAKIFWPENNEFGSISSKELKRIKIESKNILDAVSLGASRTVSLVGNIVSNIIAFLALLAFLDAALSWLGGLFDYGQLSFSLICSYLFMPLSFMMGVSWEDSFIVAELIGLKTFLNEFVAYQRLSKLIKERKAGGPEYVNNVKKYISVHSETIATYALCGFSNIASLGMSIGALSELAPERRCDISSVGLRALIAGSVACFMTACIAGILYVPDCPLLLSGVFNSTNISSSAEVLECCTQLFSSVGMFESLNGTGYEGFIERNLQGCCNLTTPDSFNCTEGLSASGH